MINWLHDFGPMMRQYIMGKEKHVAEENSPHGQEAK
jgi:hypothetical protein